MLEVTSPGMTVVYPTTLKIAPAITFILRVNKNILLPVSFSAHAF